MTLDPLLLAIVALAFIVGGAVKGVVGMGLPAVAVAILGLGLGPAEAVPILVVPTFLSNVWQALVGGHLRDLIRRFWPMLIAVVLGCILGVGIFVSADIKLLNAALGLALLLYAMLGLAKFHPVILPRHALWLQLPVGALSGLFTGMTGVVVVPVVLYLDGLRMHRDELIQALGLVFATATLTLALTLSSNSALSWRQLLLSSAALIPTAIGMIAGQALRARIAPEAFRRWLYVALILVGLSLLVKAI